MIITFGDFPPVYSKPKQATTSPYPTHQFPQPGGSYPPYPVGQAAFSPYPPAGGSGFPPYPPAPGPAATNTPYPPAFPAMPGYPPAAGGYNPTFVSTLRRTSLCDLINVYCFL